MKIVISFRFSERYI